MKRLVVLFLLAAALGFGQALIYTPNATLSWEAVTTLDNGNPIPADGVVTYEIGRSPDPIPDRNAPASLLGETAALSFPIVLPEDGVWYAFAVRTKLVADAGATVLYSPWNWSDDNGASTPNPFWYRHPSTVPPSAPLGFRGQ